jgi:hypothetical protein
VVPTVTGAAEKVPSAEEYVEQWRVMMNAATSAEQLGKTWNDQKALRNKINWPDDGTFDGLKLAFKPRSNP